MGDGHYVEGLPKEEFYTDLCGIVSQRITSILKSLVSAGDTLFGDSL